MGVREKDGDKQVETKSLVPHLQQRKNEKKRIKAKIQELVNRIKEEVHPEAIINSDGKYFIIFNKFTPDYQIVKNYTLHEFMTKDASDSFTRINLKLVIYLDEFTELTGEKFRIDESYTPMAFCRYKDPVQKEMFTDGSALMVSLARRSQIGTLLKVFKKVRRYSKPLLGIFVSEHQVYLEGGVQRFKITYDYRKGFFVPSKSRIDYWPFDIHIKSFAAYAGMSQKPARTLKYYKEGC